VAFVAPSTPGFAHNPLPHPVAQFAAQAATVQVRESIPDAAPPVSIISEQRTAAWAGPQGDDHWLRDSALTASVTLTPAAEGCPYLLPTQEKETWQHLSRPPPATGSHAA
jgi:hypothetical protein